ncbi:SirB2 family protein [Undibacterium sp. Ren11W]|uniref:SirB2 family protein n=1 Tax=Undibacterium sp. Ren11W TaxID=3413045 RepID=UPI003BF077AF
MQSYLAVKHIHITCAAISGSFFILRAYWKMRDAAILQRRWVRILPHLIDTLLLASALTLVYWSGQYPFQQNWLTAKVLALLAYIVLGTIALKRGKSARIRAYALVGAMLTFGYILAVAISRQVMPF